MSNDGCDGCRWDAVTAVAAVAAVAEMLSLRCCRCCRWDAVAEMLSLLSLLSLRCCRCCSWCWWWLNRCSCCSASGERKHAHSVKGILHHTAFWQRTRYSTNDWHEWIADCRFTKCDVRQCNDGKHDATSTWLVILTGPNWTLNHFI